MSKRASAQTARLRLDMIKDGIVLLASKGNRHVVQQ